MKVLGLTGGIGMGKSTAAQLLQARGIPVVDTDDLAHQLVEPGQQALAEISAAFGPDIRGPDGRLRRKELARRVFANPAERLRLESILHPRIRDLWHARIEGWKAEGHSLTVVVIPLLFETRAENEVDATVCVACSAATQRRRLQARGWPDPQIDQRIAAQWPIDQKMAQSHFVIWTEAPGSEIHSAQWDRILGVLAN